MAPSPLPRVTDRASASSPERSTAPWAWSTGRCGAAFTERAQNERQLSMYVFRSARSEPMEAVAFSTLQLSYW